MLWNSLEAGKEQTLNQSVCFTAFPLVLPSFCAAFQGPINVSESNFYENKGDEKFSYDTMFNITTQRTFRKATEKQDLATAMSLNCS